MTESSTNHLPEASPKPTTGGGDGSIVVHRRPGAWHVDTFPEFGLSTQRGLCGFLFTPSNAVALIERADEGEVECGRCQTIELEMHWLEDRW